MKKFLSLVLALVMTFSLVTISAGAKGFTDKEKINYSEAVDVLTDIKVIDGYTDGSFNPTGNITRGAAAKIICNLVLGPTTAAALSADAKPFKDVATTNVFAGYIAYCSQQGIINGYADGTFKPAANVTGYQLLKMLLGALGYDGKTEGFTDANWSVNVAKLALALDLTKGNDEFVGTKAATREESCLYAFNTLKGTMVEYATKGTTITVNGATITQGASKASPVARTSGTDYTGVAETATGTLQFCEKYFKNLLVTATTDEFGRPANKWTYKGVKVGTYAKTATKSYTAEVKYGTLYTDLGLSEKVTTAAYVVDGKDQTNFTIVKGGDTAIGGNGVLTEVFKTVSDTGVVTVKIVSINTYVGKINSVVAATASADRYVTVNGLSNPGTLTSGGKYETAAFAAKDLVSYTAAYTDNGTYEVQSVAALAKTASGKLTAWVGTAADNSSNSFTAGGTTYKYNPKAYVDGGTVATAFTVDSSELDVYCDANGYALYIEGTKGVTNYAAVIGVGSSNSYGSETKGATLLLADGTQKEVTAKFEASKNGTVVLTDSNLVSEGKGDLVTYTINSDGVYVLTMTGLNSAKNAATGKYATTGFAGAGKTTFTNGKSEMKIGDNTYYTTSNTVFFVTTVSGGKQVYNVYTGYAAMPTIKSTGITGIGYKLNSDYSKQLDAVYIDADALSGISSVKTYVTLKANADVTTDSTGNYYVLPAVVDGAVTTVKVDYTWFSGAGVTNKVAGVYALDSVTKDKNDIITGATKLTAESNQATTATYYTATGVVGANGAVVGFGGSKNAASTVYWAYTDKTTVTYVDKDFKTFTASSVAGIATDESDVAFFTVDSNTKVLKEVIIVDKDTTVAATTGTLTVTGLAAGQTLTVNGKTYNSVEAAAGIVLPFGTYTYTVTGTGYTTYTSASFEFKAGATTKTEAPKWYNVSFDGYTDKANGMTKALSVTHAMAGDKVTVTLSGVANAEKRMVVTATANSVSATAKIGAADYYDVNTIDSYSLPFTFTMTAFDTVVAVAANEKN